MQNLDHYDIFEMRRRASKLRSRELARLMRIARVAIRTWAGNRIAAWSASRRPALADTVQREAASQRSKISTRPPNAVYRPRREIFLTLQSGRYDYGTYARPETRGPRGGTEHRHAG